MKGKQKQVVNQLREKVLRADAINKDYCIRQWETGIAPGNMIIVFSMVGPKNRAQEKAVISKRMIAVGPKGGVQALTGKRVFGLDAVLKEGVERKELNPCRYRRREIR